MAPEDVKTDVPQAEPERAPEQAPAAIPEGAKGDVKKDSGEKLAVQAEAPAKALEEPQLQPKDEDEFVKSMRQLQEMAKKTPSRFSTAIISIAEMMIKIKKMFNGVLPQDFGKDLDTGNYAKLTFKKEEVEKIMEIDKPDSLEKMDQEKREALKKYLESLATMEEASTAYVSSMLGVDRMTSAKSLAAKLQHAEINGDKCYGQINFYALTTVKTSVPEGAVLFFKPKKEGEESPFSVEALTDAVKPSGDLIAAVATGNGHEFRYYDSVTKTEKTFDLKKDGLVDFFAFREAYMPRFNTDPDYFAEPDNASELSELADETPLGKLKRHEIHAKKIGKSIPEFFRQDKENLIPFGELKKIEEDAEGVLKGLFHYDELAEATGKMDEMVKKAFESVAKGEIDPSLARDAEKIGSVFDNLDIKYVSALFGQLIDVIKSLQRVYVTIQTEWDKRYPDKSKQPKFPGEIDVSAKIKSLGDSAEMLKGIQIAFKKPEEYSPGDKSFMYGIVKYAFEKDQEKIPTDKPEIREFYSKLISVLSELEKMKGTEDDYAAKEQELKKLWEEFGDYAFSLLPPETQILLRRFKLFKET